MHAFNNRIRLAVADDHPLVILAIEKLIANIPNIEIVCRAKDATELVEALATVECDVVIMDFFMPGGKYGDGLALIKHLTSRHPQAAKVVLSMMTDADLIGQALEAGANAVVSKQDRLELIYVAIVTILAQEDYLGPSVRALLADANVANRVDLIRKKLTRRELDVIARYAKGGNVTEIARELGRSVKTISAQKCAAMRKLDLSTDAELYRFAFDSGLVQLRRT
ncbi:response regulator transcription factor [Caballeronia telluris]|uniref:LuxR family transcriptional regulator n=1 Tax=Caballeronia telluris TaxID=326475 RepID=A0A158FQQ4_9BURK|nr:response regulator transcription factor [Caballeronia telluris]SAL22204.1 LuxR family transcriptional regulator [Caballeronia telluris]